MSTRTVSRGRTVKIDGQKVAAGLVQIGSYVTTWLFIRAIGFAGIEGFAIALIVEFVLIAGKFNFLHGRGNGVGAIAILIDSLLNAGGIFPYVQKFDNTPTWIMLQSALHLEGKMSNISALIIALLFGFLLSALPSWLWRNK